MQIERVYPLVLATLAPLIAEGVAERYSYLERLRDDFQAGRNRFEQPGEALFGAFVDGQLVAIGGLNRDPYLADPRIGRVRHVYVAQRQRGQGIGRALVATIIEAARPNFEVLTLRTDNPVAASLYASLGFLATPRYDSASHWLALRAVEADQPG